MTFVLPRDLSSKFSISLQTVYNYLTKHGSKIRTRTEHWKTFIDLEDFTNILQNRLKPFENYIEEPSNKADIQQVENFKAGFEKMELDYTLALQRSDDLEKYNINLQEQLSKYAILLTEEKAEKKEVIVKYDTLQNEFHEKVESLFREKALFEKRYFLLLGFLILLIIFIARTVLPPIFGLEQ